MGDFWISGGLKTLCDDLNLPRYSEWFSLSSSVSRPFWSPVNPRFSSFAPWNLKQTKHRSDLWHFSFVAGITHSVDRHCCDAATPKSSKQYKVSKLCAIMGFWKVVCKNISLSPPLSRHFFTTVGHTTTAFTTEISREVSSITCYCVIWVDAVTDVKNRIFMKVVGILLLRNVVIWT